MTENADLTQEVERLREQHSELLLQQEVASLRADIAVLEHSRRATEYQSSVVEQFAQRMADIYAGDAEALAFNEGRRIDLASDRRDGDFPPHFIDEQGLAAIRAESEDAYNLDTTVQAVIGSIANYVVGTEGFQYTAMAKDPAATETLAPIAKRCQEVIDELLERERWYYELQHEMASRLMYLGERPVWVKPMGEGFAQLCVLEPSWITQPRSIETARRQIETDVLPEGDYSWKYGIITERFDVSRIHGFFVVPMGEETLWSFVPAHEMSWAKVNTPRTVKRGLPDTYSAQPWSDRSKRLVTNTLEAAAVRAAISYARKHAASTTATQARTLGGSEVAMVSRADGSQVRVVKHLPGTVLDAKGFDYDWGAGDNYSGENFVSVGDAGARRFCSRWNAPPHLATGDMEAAAHASMLAAESPFTRATQRMQGRAMGADSEMLMIALGYAADAGRIPGIESAAVLRSLIKIKVDAADVAVRDRKVDEDIRALRHDRKILSRQTWSEEVGIDHEREKKRLDDEAASNAEKAAAMGLPVPLQLQGQQQPEPIEPGDGQQALPGDRIADGTAANEPANEAILGDRVRGLLLEHCGANGPGGKGFQKGNTCAKRGMAIALSDKPLTAEEHHDALIAFRDETGIDLSVDEFARYVEEE